MCGIFGVINDPNGLDEAELTLCLNSLAHRGPDQSDYYIDNNVFIGHRRLSILDLSDNGRQPMVSEDNMVILAVNGEIYNYAKIKDELTSKYQFRSASDSEIILHGYMEWGITGILERIDGMYSFVLLDRSKDVLFLVRDRVGIKPLYFSFEGGMLCWASELKAIRRYRKDLSLDNTALYDFYTYLYIPTPKTIFNNVSKLDPGHYLQFDIKDKKFSLNRYWNLSVNANDWSVEDAVVKLRDLLRESVKEQLVSDVPISFFLSGGIDSSIIVYEAASFMKELNAYTIGFNSKKDESGFAKLLASFCNVNHSIKYYDNDYFSLINKMPDWFDEPFGDTSALPSYLVSKLSVENSKVALTGDGGDELFGGYTRYLLFNKIIKKKKFNSNYIKKRLLYIYNLRIPLLSSIAYRLKIYYFLDDLELYTKLMSGMLKEEKEDLRSKLNINVDYDDYWYFRKYYKKDIPIFQRLRFLDFNTYLSDDILTKMDRVSMQVSLEARVPFLSRKIVEFAFSLPDKICLVDGKLKGILKEAYKDSLPPKILNREKRGFSVSENLLFQRNKFKAGLQRNILNLYIDFKSRIE
jgi:asparagine synthase (glutamine-hydrolysing)